MGPEGIRYTLYCVFALSGFTGLVYESVWSHYLKLFLGHAAYAQAAVLVIFMGGMAVGAWLVSRTVHRFGNLLLAYAVIEGIVGLYGLLFHPLYEFIVGHSFGTVIPVLAAPVYIHLYKFAVALALILPQSILLGATFPLMSGGILRSYPQDPGRSVSVLYFFNSAGAAIGVLCSAFYLIGKFGLPGTLFTAGLINIAIAIAVCGLTKGAGRPMTSSGMDEKSSEIWPWLFLAASFFTGMASFIYEVAWIRMLSMVLGASTHSFELMLSAFITGLAIGGYWIRKRIDRLKDPVGFAATIQVLMGLFALSTIFLYGYSFEIMAFFMAAIEQTTQGYLLFTLAGHSIALLIMLPATICAGMTLPLFTFILLRLGHGERSIGQIYASNTIGAIAGVIFTIFIGMPVLNLKGSILTGAIIDIAIGLILIFTCVPAMKPRFPVRTMAVLIAGLVIFTAFTYKLDTRQMAAGVFRHGKAAFDNTAEILFHKDGKTASVSVTELENSQISIATNGKPDASIAMGDGAYPSIDESTMVLLAALPLSIFADAKKVANIGMGSGLTAHAALSWRGIESFDTIEIEEAMVAGARYFIPRTGRAFSDPRSRIHIDDARTFFSTHQNKYDIILSEPSNPWVSGVSSLFTMEFYRSLRSYLSEDGLLVQWINMYEFNTVLLISVLKAIAHEFPYYSVYYANNADLILIASPDKPVGLPVSSIFESAEIRRELSAVHVNNVEDLRFRYLGDQTFFNIFISHFPVPANSDYYPFLDLNAEKARFLKEDASGLLDIRLSPVPILDILYGETGQRTSRLTTTSYYLHTRPAYNAYRIYDYFENNSYDEENAAAIAGLDYLQDIAANCKVEEDLSRWADSLYLLLNKTVAWLGTMEINNMINAITPQCEPAFIHESQSAWLAVFKSLGARDPAAIIKSTDQLLNSDSVLSTPQRKFLLVGLFTALITMEEYNQAINLWKVKMTELFTVDKKIPLEIQLLLAQIKLSE